MYKKSTKLTSRSRMRSTSHRSSYKSASKVLRSRTGPRSSPGLSAEFTTRFHPSAADTQFVTSFLRSLAPAAKRTRSSAAKGGAGDDDDNVGLELPVTMTKTDQEIAAAAEDALEHARKGRIIVTASGETGDVMSAFREHMNAAILAFESRGAAAPAIEMSVTDLQILAMYKSFKDNYVSIRAVKPTFASMATDTGTDAEEDAAMAAAAAAEDARQRTYADMEHMNDEYSRGSPEEMLELTCTLFFSLLHRVFSLVQYLAITGQRSAAGKLLLRTVAYLFSLLANLTIYLLQTRLGRVFVVGFFLMAYHNNNSIAVFIANVIKTIVGKIMTLSGADLLAQKYYDQLISTAQAAILGGIVHLLQSPAVAAAVEAFSAKMTEVVASQTTLAVTTAVTAGAADAAQRQMMNSALGMGVNTGLKMIAPYLDSVLPGLGSAISGTSEALVVARGGSGGTRRPPRPHRNQTRRWRK